MGAGCRSKRQRFFAQAEKGQKLIPLEGLQVGQAFDGGGWWYGKRCREKVGSRGSACRGEIGAEAAVE
ncbi:hypothetical protein MPNT_550003 [Candidatus Methylacidithermus pantelleriae]|uniref:Uncharacterized protein n=1 Tax=Candidatus Methylacidithermus pantelleriae TaxID=2744239 RepID=A0A8J2BQX6_9BACT|nr:hypothetical protein MPNT_550003 [Candidatus Methylacidithermus pantelleriae]